MPDQHANNNAVIEPLADILCELLTNADALTNADRRGFQWQLGW